MKKQVIDQAVILPEFKIDKDKLLAHVNRWQTVHQGRPYRYPFEKLEVGDSFLVEMKDESDYKKTINGITSCKTNAEKKLKIKLITRKVREDEIFGIRVWRIK
jgi:hypothetical protein